MSCSDQKKAGIIIVYRSDNTHLVTTLMSRMTPNVFVCDLALISLLMERLYLSKAACFLIVYNTIIQNNVSKTLKDRKTRRLLMIRLDGSSTRTDKCVCSDNQIRFSQKTVRSINILHAMIRSSDENE